MRRDVTLEVERSGQRLLRQVVVDLDGFGEHLVAAVEPVDDLTEAERTVAIDLAEIAAGSPGCCTQ